MAVKFTYVIKFDKNRIIMEKYWPKDENYEKSARFSPFFCAIESLRYT